MGLSAASKRLLKKAGGVARKAMQPVKDIYHKRMEMQREWKKGRMSGTKMGSNYYGSILKKK